MNIAIFSPNQNPYSETFIQAHKNYLKGNIFYYFGSGSQIQLEGQERLMPLLRYKILRVFAKLFRKPSAYLWQERILYSLKVNNIDAILVEYGNHAHHLLPILKALQKSIVVHFHGYDASHRDVISRCNNYEDVFNVATYIVAVSKVMNDNLLKMGCPKGKLVYNVYGPQPEFHEVHPIFNKKQFIGIGRFTDKKAPYYTILAFNQVLSKHPDATLLMAGDGDLHNMCKNLIRHFKLEKSITLLGIINPKQFRTLLSESLAFVQHSITAENGDMEGTPLAVLEASCAGVPVIATSHAGISDVIVHKKSGLLCDEHDVDAMAENMLCLLDNVNYAKELGLFGKKHIASNFSMERHIKKLDEILLEAIENK
ncbi:glycosyltransferase [Mariniflexile sp.]